MKVAIFYTDHDNEWTKPYGNFVNFSKQLLDYDNGDRQVEYVVFDVYGGELPSYGELADKGIDKILITGSRYDSFDRETEWINKLRELIHEIVTDKDGHNIKLCGICFGHQIIANALNYEVKRNPLGNEFGLFEIKLNAVGKKIFGDVVPDDILQLAEFHSDTVTYNQATSSDTDRIELQNWGATERSEIQGFYLKNKILTFQGHPEFETKVVVNGLNAKVDDQTERDRRSKGINKGLECSKVIWNLYQGHL